MIKNIYDPDNEDILSWLNNNEKWPASDWDYYVMNGKNDDLVYNFANDIKCSKKEFFIHCLYYFVGDIYNSNNIQKYSLRIKNLLEKDDKNMLPQVKEWKKRLKIY